MSEDIILNKSESQ